MYKGFKTESKLIKYLKKTGPSLRGDVTRQRSTVFDERHICNRWLTHISGISDYGPAILEHVLLGAGFKENVKLGPDFQLASGRIENRDGRLAQSWPDCVLFDGCFAQSVIHVKLVQNLYNLLSFTRGKLDLSMKIYFSIFKTNFYTVHIHI